MVNLTRDSLLHDSFFQSEKVISSSLHCLLSLSTKTKVNFPLIKPFFSIYLSFFLSFFSKRNILIQMEFTSRKTHHT